MDTVGESTIKYESVIYFPVWDGYAEHEVPMACEVSLRYHNMTGEYDVAHVYVPEINQTLTRAQLTSKDLAILLQDRPRLEVWQ